MPSFTDKLKKVFGISTATDKKNTQKTIIRPADYDSEAGKTRTITFPDDIERLYKLWLTDALDSGNSLKNRLDRVKELSYAYYNSSIFSIATRLYSDETLSADEQDQILKISAKNPKLETYITEFFEKIGITNSVLKSLAFDLSLYGDHFWVLATDDKEGITKITPIDITTIKDRIEFNAIQVAKLENQFRYQSLLSKEPRLQALVQVLTSDQASLDYSKYFQSYLFGYQTEGDLFLPPWNILHFRILTHSSEFVPFGRPILINCLSPFKQLQTSKNLMAIARANNFPIKMFKVKVADSMTAMDQWDVVTQAREQYENLMGISNKEQFSVNGAVWVPEGLITMESIEMNYDMDKIADVEMLKMDLADGTGIPADYLSSSASSWGKSNQSLLQQSKLFARGVFTIQTAIIDELISLVKLQLIMTEDFDEDEEFELSLNFPAEEGDSDKLRQTSDSLDTAKTIIDNLGQVLGVEEGNMPIDVVKDILTKISFLSSNEINKYLKSIEDAKKEQEAKAEAEAKERAEQNFKLAQMRGNGKDGSDEEDGSNEDFGSAEDEFDYDAQSEDMEEAVREKIKERLTTQLIREAYFKAKRKLNLQEGVMRNRHYGSSWKVIDVQRKTLYEIMKKNKKSGKLIETTPLIEEKDIELDYEPNFDNS